ncbi:Site-specific recombinase XerD [Hymenobacter psychrophilus]|uniref:Site-specific recombinase XerD n=2 Tax=Hymenobacter psychrophilus TaxID=651662 RepID=A0A1H3NCQ0_9BACT|nr:Site-specific recombinase XerD [Hymenobacter psychrophilus]
MRLGESVLPDVKSRVSYAKDAPFNAPLFMVTQFVLRSDKKDRAGRCPVHLVVYFEGVRLKCATGEKCRLADWNADKQHFRRSYPLAEEANDLLRLMSDNVLKWWRTLRATGQAPTLAGLRAALRPAPEPEPTTVRPVAVAYEQYRQAMRARGYSRETLRQHVVARNWFTGFEQWSGQPLDPGTYDLARHDALLGYLREVRGLAPNSLYTAVKDLKSFLRFLRDERAVCVPIELRRLVAKPADSPKLYLSAADLQALASAMLPANLVATRDVFLFCCYTGLRYSDVSALHAGNLQEWNGGRLLRLVQSKTRAGVSIYLTAAASAILDKYADAERLRLLPVHPNQVMNRYLKRVARLAGLTGSADLVSTGDGGIIRAAVPTCELVTMHTARHTFATQSLLRGMPVEVLQKVLGHKKIQTTLIYAKIVEDFQHHTMRRIWEGSPPQEDELVGAVCAVEPAA